MGTDVTGKEKRGAAPEPAEGGRSSSSQMEGPTRGGGGW